ncbi:MAG: hypothetical protein JRJ66_17265 [Deltaproteobacteria bacterium]|nr:hypothetical protein [Deltaproteobacteria bacterium]
MEHSPKPGSHFVVEPLLPTRPVGIGWVERCIPLPLGIEGTSLERCFFIDQKGEAYGDQLKFLKKVRRFDVKSAIRNLRSLGQVPGVLKTRSESFPPLVERLRRDCKVVDYLVQKALSGHMMRREEKVALFYTIGLLHGGGNTIHRILESTPDYNYRKTERQLERLQRNPVSCGKIRSMIPEITVSVDCSCHFDLRGGKYPSPLLHVMPQMVPASGEFDVPDRLQLEEAAKRYVQLRSHVEEEQVALKKLERVLDNHFTRKGISRYTVSGRKITRDFTHGGINWRLERA